MKSYWNCYPKLGPEVFETPNFTTRVNPSQDFAPPGGDLVLVPSQRAMAMAMPQLMSHLTIIG
jgi:hypothetical protein